ncbi:beta family protein [Maricaulis maris]|uniref:beta family protein n=1 Tax=Maricaulis maris TaxID=74318 RepID=UPI003A8CE41B
MDSENFSYFPILKTKDAELRAISNLDILTAGKILPTYELTKSRITKKDSIGDIAKRVQEIANIQGKRPFILDVTTDPKQTNSQTEALLSPTAGYRNWQVFLGAHSALNVIPIIHIDFVLDPSLTETTEFVKAASHSYSTLALRLPPYLEKIEYEQILNAVTPHLEESKIDLLLDAGCIRKVAKKEGINPIANQFSDSFQEIIRISKNIEWLRHVVCIAGSFPLIVSQEGGDEKGDFEIYEQTLWTSLRGVQPRFKFGDYASINAAQVEIRGGTFVPRIDFCTDDRFFYHRYRRNEGSYAKCARQVVDDVNYRTFGTWGDEEIMTAATAIPSGISPSFWISTRANRYMTHRTRIYQAK